MKRVLAVIVGIGMVMAAACKKSETPAEKGSLKGTLSISGAFALYPMAVKWAEEFCKIHPQVQIDISAGGAGKGMADVLAGLVDIGMVSREIQPVEVERGAWAVPVAKDAVVAMVNEKNPFVDTLRRAGMKREQFQVAWLGRTVSNWEQLLGVRVAGAPTALQVYTRSDSCGAAETWAQFLGKNQEDLKGVGVFGDPGLAEAVKKDPLGIGFNNINFAYDPTTLRSLEGLSVVPIDLNGDGCLDANEDFYGTRETLVRAVSEDRYPSPPARDLYFVCKGKPQKEVLVAFLQWVLSEGQKMVTDAGYVSPTPGKISKGIDRLQGK